MPLRSFSRTLNAWCLYLAFSTLMSFALADGVPVFLCSSNLLILLQYRVFFVFVLSPLSVCCSMLYCLTVTIQVTTEWPQRIRVWSALENFMSEQAHVSFGVCSKSNSNRQIPETNFLYHHPLKIGQGFAIEGSIQCTCGFRSDG